MENDQLYHWGIKGMKWGRRRFQNKDGSLTPAGRARYEGGDSDSKKTAKKPSESKPAPTRDTMDARQLRSAITKLELRKQHKKLENEYEDGNDDLREGIARLQLQKQYNQLYNEVNPPKVDKGRQMAEKILNDAVIPATSEAIKSFARSAVDMLGKKYLGVEDAGASLKSEADNLKREAENALNRRKIAQVEDYMKERQRKADEEKAAKDAEKQAEKDAKQAEKQAEKQAAKDAKQAEKDAKQAEKQAAKDAKQAEKQAQRDAERAREAYERAREEEQQAWRNRRSDPADDVEVVIPEVVGEGSSFRANRETVNTGRQYANDIIDTNVTSSTYEAPSWAPRIEDGRSFALALVNRK